MCNPVAGDERYFSFTSEARDEIQRDTFLFRVILSRLSGKIAITPQDSEIYEVRQTIYMYFAVPPDLPRLQPVRIQRAYNRV